MSHSVQRQHAGNNPLNTKQRQNVAIGFVSKSVFQVDSRGRTLSRASGPGRETHQLDSSQVTDCKNRPTDCRSASFGFRNPAVVRHRTESDRLMGASKDPQEQQGPFPMAADRIRRPASSQMPTHKLHRVSFLHCGNHLPVPMHNHFRENLRVIMSSFAVDTGRPHFLTVYR